MLKSIRHYFVLSFVTLRELTCEPVCVILTILCSTLIGIIPLMLMHNFGESGKLARDGALAFQLLFGLAISVSAASSAINRDLTRGTAASLLSKPLPRSLFLLAKFTGVVMLIAIFSTSVTISALLAERISERMVYSETFVGSAIDHGTALRMMLANLLALIWGGWQHWRHGRFGPAVIFSQPILLLGAALLSGCFSRVGEWQPYNLNLELRIIPVSLLVFMALFTLSAISTSLSTCIKTGPTLAISITILFLGLLLDAFVPRHGIPALALRTLVPNWQHFWQCDSLDNGGALAPHQLKDAAIYALTYSAAILTLGVTMIRQRDIS